ncbi:MAG: helix-turn-helix domain-containing protein [Limnohabitans sp.]
MDTVFTLDQLCTLADCTKRTVRYYVQLGLVDRPVGETRAARYGRRHLEQLLQIRQLSESGVSLERIREVLGGDTPPVPAKARAPGSVQVRSHVWVAPGVELQIDPQEAGMPVEQLHNFVQAVMNHWSQHHEQHA